MITMPSMSSPPELCRLYNVICAIPDMPINIGIVLRDVFQLYSMPEKLLHDTIVDLVYQQVNGGDQTLEINVKEPTLSSLVLAYCIASYKKSVSAIVTYDMELVIDKLLHACNYDPNLMRIVRLTYAEGDSSVYVTLHNKSLIWVIGPSPEEHRYPDMLDFLYLDNLILEDDQKYLADIANVTLNIYQEWNSI